MQWRSILRAISMCRRPAFRETTASSSMTCPRMSRKYAPPYSMLSTGSDRLILRQASCSRVPFCAKTPVSMPIRCWRQVSGSSLFGATPRGPAHSHRGCPLSCSPFTNRTGSAPDGRHRPAPDAGRRAASGGWLVMTTRDAGRKTDRSQYDCRPSLDAGRSHLFRRNWCSERQPVICRWERPAPTG